MAMISIGQDARGFEVHGNVNNQVYSNSNIGTNNMGNSQWIGAPSPMLHTPGMYSEQNMYHPTASVTPPMRTLPSIKSASRVESRARPQSTPLQVEHSPIVPPTQRTTTPPTPSPSLSHSETPALPLVPPPEYKVGVIRALDAQAHLTDKTLETIGKLLKKTQRTITANRWIAQAGFMHDRKEFSDVYQYDGQYSAHNQIIIVTVFSSSSMKQRSCDRLAEKMSVVLGGFYGLLVWKKTVAVMRPSRPHKVPKDVTLFGEETQIGVFQNPAIAPSQNSISVTASNHWSSHASYLHTQVRYKALAEPDGRSGSQTVEVSDLSFKGPEEYELRKASFKIVTDARCDFQNIVPRPRGLVDTDGQYKESIQDCKTQSKTGTLGVEASQSGARASGTVSMTAGESHSTSRDTMRNGIAVVHDTDAYHTVITFIPAHPEHDMTQLTVPENDLPRVTVCPASAGSQLGTVTVRTLSTWRVKQLETKTPSLGGRFSAICRLKHKPDQLQHRKDADIVFCTEVAVPQGTSGVNSVSPRMDVCF